MRDWRGIVHWRAVTQVGVATICGIPNVFQFEGWNGPVRANVDCMSCLSADAPIMPLPEDFRWLDVD